MVDRAGLNKADSLQSHFCVCPHCHVIQELSDAGHKEVINFDAVDGETEAQQGCPAGQAQLIA